MKRYDVIVIGAGVAGMTAAIYAKRAGLSTLVLEAKVHGGAIVESSHVGNFPGFEAISGTELTDKIYHHMNNLGVEFSYENVEMVTVNEGFISDNDGSGEIGGRFLVKTDEKEYSCGAIILAVGTEPRKLSEKQAKSAGNRPISYCATCDGPLYKGKTVVVVGSGNTAKYEMKYLSNIAAKVLHIHHDEPIPEEAEAVFVAIGRVPATAKFEGLVDLDADDYIIAGEDCKTSMPGVFAAGDCRTKNTRQLVTAAGDGAVAANGAVQFLK